MSSIDEIVIDQALVEDVENTDSINSNYEHQEENIEQRNTPSEVLEIIYDAGQWKTIDEKFRDLIIKKGLIRHNNLQFPKDKNSRHFSSSFYQRILSNE